ncbi:MAG TPA: hypothetical protein VM925_26380 [Labilithrix sp.]|nr:hypothetical protein [Labilithrix sp.]
MVSLASEFPNDNPALHRGVIWVCLEPTGRALPERAPAGDAATDDASVVAVDETVPPTVREEEGEVIEAASSASGSLAPPEDDHEDDIAASIVVEELEPVEACVEGGASNDYVEPLLVPAAVESEVVLGEAMDEPLAPPRARVSEVVLAGTRVEAPEPAPLPPLVVSDVDTSESERGPAAVPPPPPDDPFTVLVCRLVDVAISAGSPHVASLLPALLECGHLPAGVDPEGENAVRAAGLWDGGELSPSFVAVARAWRAILRGTSDDFDACGASTHDEWASDLLARLLRAPAKAPSLRQELRSRGVAAFGLVEAA